MKKPAHELINLTPATNQFLPDVRAYATPAVWRRVAGNAKFDPDDERCQDVSLYLVFAVIGAIGRSRIRTSGCETNIIPLAFQTGHFDVLVTITNRARSLACVTLSLPDESVTWG